MILLGSKLIPVPAIRIIETRIERNSQDDLNKPLVVLIDIIYGLVMICKLVYSI